MYMYTHTHTYTLHFLAMESGSLGNENPVSEHNFSDQNLAVVLLCLLLLTLLQTKHTSESKIKA